ncbi:hypothetical protein DRH27_04020 [Candidatus Falkowbacteria bacterium]|nr:MAG: hypothetical protein DRH27_04020 [Candidatus Falkowbacteria bacterium]
MHNQLQKAIDLARKTGDRLIVYNSEKKDIFVVMSLDEYENLVIGKSEVRNLTEDELLDKINRDVAIWKSEKNYSPTNSPSREFYDQDDHDDYDGFSDFSKIDEILDKADQKISKFSKSKFDKDDLRGEKTRKNHWVIPSERKEAAEEIIEEDRQYLIDEEKF